MTPWRAAFGLTLALGAAGFWWARAELGYLAPYAPLLLERHGARLAAEAAALVAVVYGTLYRAASVAALNRLGRKLAVEQRSLKRGAGYDPALAESLDRDSGSA